ncbi:MAG: tripartite tricarboxylate transporter substrate binding protein [Pseudomonadota bacterium]|nr:tripartite tricarboxylate transporter substrate binding protein [Pseudomonadota bacterium]
MSIIETGAEALSASGTPLLYKTEGQAKRNPEEMMMTRIFGRLLVWLLFAAVAGAGPAQAQTYPERPVRLISPFAPGGGTDILGRFIAQKFSEIWGGDKIGGVNMIVENRAGASGNVGAQAVARSDPDGYTLLMAVNSHAINANIYKKIPFDLMRDFAPVGMVATSPFVLVVNSALPVRSVSELIAYAKARPGQLNYGSAGFATAPHVAGELFNLMAGIDMRHIPYQGSGPNVMGLLRNDVQLSAISLNSIEGHLAGEQVRVLAVMGSARYPGLPDVPTVAESGLPGYEVDLWYALLAPAKTPSNIVAKLNADLKRVLESKDMQEGLPPRGFLPAYSTPEELAKIIQRDLTRWKELTERVGLKVD